MTTGRPPRVAIVGPRRVRTGLGPFLAKHLVAHGAEVPAFIASRKETIEDGRWALRNAGVDAQGFTDLDALLEAHPTVDGLAIASPHATHRRWLDAALDRGLHVLCEKPLVWGDASSARETALVVERAVYEKLVLFENCPWPCVLPAFDALHPAARREPVRTFEMELAPSSSAPRDMLADSMSHPLSVLQAVAAGEPRSAGDPPLSNRRWDAAEDGRVELSFTFRRADATEPVAVRVRLTTVPRQPRPAALVVNGFRADRVLRMEDYSMSLAGGGREVELGDPMAALAGEFVRAVRHGEPAGASRRRANVIAERAALFDLIVGSFPGA